MGSLVDLVSVVSSALVAADAPHLPSDFIDWCRRRLVCSAQCDNEVELGG